MNPSVKIKIFRRHAVIYHTAGYIIVKKRIPSTKVTPHIEHFKNYMSKSMLQGIKGIVKIYRDQIPGIFKCFVYSKISLIALRFSEIFLPLMNPT